MYANVADQDRSAGEPDSDLHGERLSQPGEDSSIWCEDHHMGHGIMQGSQYRSVHMLECFCLPVIMSLVDAPIISKYICKKLKIVLT